MSNFALIKQFHEKFDPINTGESLETLIPRRLGYLLEELQEAATAADEYFGLAMDEKMSQDAVAMRTAKAAMVKELVDVLHVTYGFLHMVGVDADAAFAEVHTSNMSKTPNPGGKASKSASYQPANMEKFV